MPSEGREVSEVAKISADRISADFGSNSKRQVCRTRLPKPGTNPYSVPFWAGARGEDYERSGAGELTTFYMNTTRWPKA